MPSYRYYMAMKLDDLRHELASRNLPTEGLKKDLAFRLASLDDAQDCNPLVFYPHRTDASLSISNDEDGKTGTREAHDVRSAEVGEGSCERSSPSPVDLSFPSLHDHRDDDCRKRSLARFSIEFTKAVLPILLMVFLSCILRFYVSTVAKEYFSRSIANGYDFPSSKIKQLSRVRDVAILKWLPFNI